MFSNHNSRFKSRKLILISVLFICLIYWISSWFTNNFQGSYQDEHGQEYKEISKNFFETCEDYKTNCLNLFHNLRYPRPGSIHRPPLKEIPSELLKDFEQNGYMPSGKSLYFNDMLSDADSKDKRTRYRVNKDAFDYWKKRVQKNEPLGYGNTVFQPQFENYKTEIDSKSMVIIGTVEPWLEALAYEMNASKIITLDYTRKYWHDRKLEWYHVNDFLDNSLAAKVIENFDNAATFSSIEHSGLGRFGDPLNSDGDLDAMKQVHCMMKPGGLFFIGGLDNRPTDKGQIQFNAHRIYGKKRLELLFKGWKLEFEHREQGIFVLRKPQCHR